MSGKYEFERGTGLDYIACDEEGTEVGQVLLEEQEFPVGYGTHSTFTVVRMDVDEAHRRQGIATGLVQLALADHPDLLFPDLDPAESKDMGGDYRYMLESDGQKLVASLLRRNIITHVNLMSSAGDEASVDETYDVDPWGDGSGYAENEGEEGSSPVIAVSPSSLTVPFATQHGSVGSAGQASSVGGESSDEEGLES